MSERKIKERRYGVTEWNQYSYQKPPYFTQLILCVLENGRGRFIPSAMYRLDDKFTEIKSSKRCKNGNGLHEITREKILDPATCDDIAWVEVTKPDWWVSAEKDKKSDDEKDV